MAPKQTQPEAQAITPEFGQGEDNKHPFTFNLPDHAQKTAAIYPFGQHTSHSAGGNDFASLGACISTNLDNASESEPSSNPSIPSTDYVSFVDIDTLTGGNTGTGCNSLVEGSSSIHSNINTSSLNFDNLPCSTITTMVLSTDSSSPKPSQAKGQAEAPAVHKPLPPILPLRRPFKASCTHPTMTRVYGVDHRCDSCGRYPPFGWLYRCTQDREELLRQMIHVGSDQATFDELGRELIGLVKPRPRGPEARADTIGSFFNEITPEQLQTYRPDQIATILKQRENVKAVIQQDTAKKQADAEQQLAALQTMREKQPGAERQLSPSAADTKSNDARWQQLERERPWVPRPETECTYKVCPQCRPSGADRITMSLDAVVNGDVPATAATGFGFHHFGQRPVCDISIVANMGLPRPQEPSTPVQTNDEYSMANLDDLMARHEQQFREWQLSRQERRSEEHRPIANISPSKPHDKGHLPRSPGSPDLKHVAETKEEQGRLSPTATTDMEVREMKRGEFEAAPLKVDEGIAVLEESVELHVPDVVTQI
ncbi:hypothetical protein ACHAQA_008898 [Verticillium albo-atrum]